MNLASPFRPWRVRQVTVWRELGEHHRATYLARSTLFLVVSPVQVPARVRALGGESKGRLVYSEYPMNVRIGHSYGKQGVEIEDGQNCY